MKPSTNIMMLVLVVALIAFPLWRVQKPAPGPDGKEAEKEQKTEFTAT